MIIIKSYKIGDTILYFNEIYYINYSSGLDTNKGLSKETAFKTLTKAHSISNSSNDAFIIIDKAFFLTATEAYSGSKVYKNGCTYIGDNLQSTLLGSFAFSNNTLIRLRLENKNIDGTTHSVSAMLNCISGNNYLYNCFYAYHYSGDGSREFLQGGNIELNNCIILDIPSTINSIMWTTGTIKGKNNIFSRKGIALPNDVFPLQGIDVDQVTGKFLTEQQNNNYLDIYGIYSGTFNWNNKVYLDITVYTHDNMPKDLLLYKNSDIIYLEYSGKPIEITLPPGKYKCECWGAESGLPTSQSESALGAVGISDISGKGGYTSGILSIFNNLTLFGYCGEHPDSIGSPFNGGGRTLGNNVTYSTAGGGGTDIRLANGNWDNITSLRSRIMVAGGGGAGFRNYLGVNGGHGGGLEGIPGTVYPPGSTGPTAIKDTQGTQTKGGNARELWGQTKGSFGKGGDCDAYAGTGGGGYYGGGAGSTGYSGEAIFGGGGGSSFISGMTGCNAINSNGAHTNQPIHYSGLSFTDCETKSGVRRGHGLIIITVIESKSRSYFFNKNGLQYKINEILYPLNKNIINVTMEDFSKYGMSKQEWEGKEKIELIFTDTKNILTYDIIPLDQIIINHKPIIIPTNNNISKIIITDEPKTDIIKYLIYNGKDWYSYKNGWEKVSLLTSEIIKNGMTSIEISNYDKIIWNELFNNQVEKQINFCCLINTNLYDSLSYINKINITTVKKYNKEIKDNFYEVYEEYDGYKIIWKTNNKSKVRIIHSN